MSDEKSPSEDPVVAEAHESGTGGTASKTHTPPAVALAFMLIALLGVLIATAWKNGSWRSATGNSELVALQAELDSLRSELKEDSEPVEDIAARMQKDVDSLASLAVNYQKLLGEKDGELAAKNAEILRAEKIRHELAEVQTQRATLAAELAAARQQIEAMSAAASVDDYADLKRRFDETLRAKEFFEARAKTLEANPNK